MTTLLKKNHWKYILVLVLLTGVFYWNALSFHQMIYSECLVAEVANFKVAQDGLLHGEMPLWMPNYHGGIPFFANAQNAVLHYNVLLGMLSPTFQGGCNLGILVNTFLAGLFMFYLLIYLGLKERDAFISGVVYMFCGFAITHSITIQSRYAVFAWTPLLFLVVHRALHEDAWIKNSIIAGIVLAVIGHSSGFDFFLYAVSIIFPIIFLFSLWGDHLKARLFKAAGVAIIIGIIFLGLMAIRILPLLEWGDVSSKGQGFSYEDSIGGHLSFKTAQDWITFIINPPNTWVEHNSYASLGPLVVLLVLFSIPLWRKKNVLTFVGIALAGFLIGAGTLLYYPLWKFVPGIAQGHHVDRFLFLYQFGMSVLAGFGASRFFAFVEKKWLQIKIGQVFAVLVILLFLSSAIFSAESIYGRKTIDLDYSLKNNQLLNYLSQQPGIFRVHNIGTQTIAGFAGMYAVFLKLEILYGTSPIWVYDYLNEYLTVTYSDPAKFYGMLNTKYIYSDKELTVPGLQFVKKFDKCQNCLEDYGTDKGIDGPYLYENLEYLPRAYLPDKSILIVGETQQEKEIMYGIMKLPEFIPSRENLVMGKSSKVDDYSPDFLQHFDAVILVSGADAGDGTLLASFVRNGGHLLPNLFENKTSMTPEEVSTFLKMYGTTWNTDELNFTTYSPDYRVISLPGKSGFLQLSEKFYLIPGWNAYADGQQREILRSDGVNSAIWINGEKELVLKYDPDSYRVGKWITVGTITLLLIFFILYHRKQQPL